MSTEVAELAGRRQLAPIYGAGFVTAFAAHAVAANLGLYATSRHDSLWELGLLLALYDGAEVVLKPVFGLLVDRKGPKPVMVGGLIAFSLASLAFVAGGDPHLLGAARLAQGAAAAAFSPAAGAAIAALGGRKRTGRLFGGYGGAKGVGYLLGPVAGGALVVGGGYTLLFGILSALGMLGALTAVLFVPDLEPAARPSSNLVEFARRTLDWHFVRPVVLLGAATAALSVGVGFFPVLGARHHLSPLATGALVSLLAATAAVIQPLCGRMIDGGRLRRIGAPLSLLVCSGGFALATVAPSAVGIAGAGILVGTGVALGTPLGFTLLAEWSAPDRLGSTMGAAEMGRELGDAGGPVLVGTLAFVSLTAGLGGFALVMLACASLVGARSHVSFGHRTQTQRAS